MYASIDIGGTKTLIAVFTEKGIIKEQIKYPTPAKYEDFVDEMASTVANLSTKEFKGCGLALPGIVDRNEGVGVFFGNLPWRNVPLAADVEAIFNAPAAVENDAKLAALSEALLVKDKYRKVLYITVSTGIGVALVVDGEIDVNIGDGGGKNMVLEHNGKNEAWEDFASGSAIVRRFGKRASEIDDEKTWKIIARDISVGLRDVIAMMEPEVVIVGGGVGTHFKKYGAFVNEELRKYETPMLKMPPVIGAVNPEEAVIYGGYELAKRNFGHGS